MPCERYRLGVTDTAEAHGRQQDKHTAPRTT
jgi:hypothetical protein